MKTETRASQSMVLPQVEFFEEQPSDKHSKVKDEDLKRLKVAVFLRYLSTRYIKNSGGEMEALPYIKTRFSCSV